MVSSPQPDTDAGRARIHGEDGELVFSVDGGTGLIELPTVALEPDIDVTEALPTLWVQNDGVLGPGGELWVERAELCTAE